MSAKNSLQKNVHAKCLQKGVCKKMCTGNVSRKQSAKKCAPVRQISRATPMYLDIGKERCTTAPHSFTTEAHSFTTETRPLNTRAQPFTTRAHAFATGTTSSTRRAHSFTTGAHCCARGTHSCPSEAQAVLQYTGLRAWAPVDDFQNAAARFERGPFVIGFRCPDRCSNSRGGFENASAAAATRYTG